MARCTAPGASQEHGKRQWAPESPRASGSTRWIRKAPRSRRQHRRAPKKPPENFEDTLPEQPGKH
eukprot:14800416-Alexandrium_andersonii.AAC.1